MLCYVLMEVVMRKGEEVWKQEAEVPSPSCGLGDTAGEIPLNSGFDFIVSNNGHELSNSYLLPLNSLTLFSAN